MINEMVRLLMDRGYPEASSWMNGLGIGEKIRMKEEGESSKIKRAYLIRAKNASK